MIEKAAELATKFNVASGTDRPINFRTVFPMKVTKHGLKIGEWIVAEQFLYGVYTKWLSNNGWVNSEVGLSLTAFSHWTWVKTGGQVLVCDLQGVRDNPKGYWLTDPAIHSPQQEYGNTDLGNVGIHNFFDTHKCTKCCNDLGIHKKWPQRGSHRPSGGLAQRSSSYCDADVKKMNRFVPKLDVIQE